MYVRGNSLERLESELLVGRKTRRCSISNRMHIVPNSYLYFYLQIHFYVIFFVRFLPFPSKSKKGYVKTTELQIKAIILPTFEIHYFNQSLFCEYNRMYILLLKKNNDFIYLWCGVYGNTS